MKKTTKTYDDWVEACRNVSAEESISLRFWLCKMTEKWPDRIGDTRKLIKRLAADTEDASILVALAYAWRDHGFSLSYRKNLLRRAKRVAVTTEDWILIGNAWLCSGVPFDEGNQVYRRCLIQAIRRAEKGSEWQHCSESCLFMGGGLPG